LSRKKRDMKHSVVVKIN